MTRSIIIIITIVVIIGAGIWIYSANNKQPSIPMNEQNMSQAIASSSSSSPEPLPKVIVTVQGAGGPGADWKIGSSYTVNWSLSGVPQSTAYDYTAVVFLTRPGAGDVAPVEDAIITQDAKNGPDSATYKVGRVTIGSDAVTSIVPGGYDLTVKVFRSAVNKPRLGYGELVAQATNGTINVMP